MSLLLAVVALGLHLAGMSEVGRGVHTRARAVTLSESERAVAKVEASRYSKRGVVIARIGLPIALASVGFLIASARKHEPAWRSLTFALLVFYVMLQFMLV